MLEVRNRADGLRYLRWGVDGEAVRPKMIRRGDCLGCVQHPQRQVHALLARGRLAVCCIALGDPLGAPGEVCASWMLVLLPGD